MAKRKVKKSAKSMKAKVTRTTKRKSATRKRKSGDSFYIDKVPTLI